MSRTTDLLLSLLLLVLLRVHWEQLYGTDAPDDPPWFFFGVALLGLVALGSSLLPDASTAGTPPDGASTHRTSTAETPAGGTSTGGTTAAGTSTPETPAGSTSTGETTADGASTDETSPGGTARD